MSHAARKMEALASWAVLLSRSALTAGTRGMSSTSASSKTAMIKQLREKSGAPITDVKKFLDASGWDADKAYDELRKKGLAAIAKKANRQASEGLVGLARSADASAAAVVEINSETDFVARNDMFQRLVGQAAQAALGLKPKSGGAQYELDVDESLAPGLGRIASVVVLEPKSKDDCAKLSSSSAVKDLGEGVAMHAAGLRPIYLDRQSVPAEALEKERGILMQQAAASGKPEAMVAKMTEGRLVKYYEENCLLEQKYLMDDSVRVKAMVDRVGKAEGLGLTLPAFLRVQCGEGIEVQKADFATEVESLVKGSS
eukprot:gene28990-32182_t